MHEKDDIETAFLHKESPRPPTSPPYSHSREDDSMEDDDIKKAAFLLKDQSPSTPKSPPSQSREEQITEEQVRSTDPEDPPLNTQPESSSEVQTAAAVITTVSKPILTVALTLFFLYLTLGVVTYTWIPNEFSGTKTNVIVDSLYFSIVTLSTVGYGDIAPLTTKSKLLTMVLVIIGAFSLEYLLNRIVTHLLDLQENAILGCMNTPLIVDEGKIKTKWKLCFVILALVFCVIVATLFLHHYEKLDLVDSLYLSVISVATVGYGDKAFETLVGRVFAVCWILVSSVAVTSFFYYFAKTRIGGSVMQLEANMSESKAENGKVEFILSKLLEADKITEVDKEQVLEEYKRSR